MDINELRTHLNKTISLKTEIKELKKTDRFRSLAGYLEQFIDSIGKYKGTIYIKREN